MPELPEVETIRRGLTKFIVKKKLVSCAGGGEWDSEIWKSDGD